MTDPEPNHFALVWLFAFYPTNGGISEHDDSFIRGVMTRNDGELVGSGTMMAGDNPERDIQCRIKRRRAETVARVLQNAGYRTEIREIPRP
jgi:hypothetical protein